MSTGMAQHLSLILGVLLTCVTHQISCVLRVADTGAVAATVGLSDVLELEMDNKNVGKTYDVIRSDLLAGDLQISNTDDAVKVAVATNVELPELAMNNQHTGKTDNIIRSNILAGDLQISIVDALMRDRLHNDNLPTAEDTILSSFRELNKHRKTTKIVGDLINNEERSENVDEGKVSDITDMNNQKIHNVKNSAIIGSSEFPNRQVQPLIVNTAILEDTSNSQHRNNNQHNHEQENAAHGIVPSTKDLSIPTQVEELDGVIIGSIIGGFVAVWGVVVVTIICCSFCNYEPLHRERLAEIYIDAGMEDNWYTMSDYSNYKREYQRI